MQSRRPGARRLVVDEVGAALRSAATGTGPRTLVLTAGPGSGKSHTLRELVAEAHTTGRWSTADELSWRQPYSVISDLVEMAAPTPAPADFGDRVFAAVDALCADAPQLLVVDDAHNADSASLEVLARAAAAARDLPLTILVARRHLPERELLRRLTVQPLVREWVLPRMDAAEMDDLIRAELGEIGDDRLRRAIADRSAGNPMHALALIRGHLEHDPCGGLGETATVDTSLHRSVRSQLALLDQKSRDLVDRLAVWGGTALVSDLAALGEESPAELVGAVRTAVDAGVVDLAVTGALSFTHDMYADVAYSELARPLRAVLHSAIAGYHTAAGDRQLAAHHHMAAGARGPEMVAAVDAATGELAHAPAVAADLLNTASRLSTADSSARPIALQLATALARSGQLDRAAQVAAEGLREAVDSATAEKLHSILIFTLINRADAAAVHELIERTLQLPVDEATRAQMHDIGFYVDLMEGVETVPARQRSGAGGSAIGMEAEALRRFVSGDISGALDTALTASRLGGDVDADVELNRAVEVWPPMIELYLHGPSAAEALLTRALQQRSDRDIPWLSSYLEFVRGSIELARGRLDDAAATLDSALEPALASQLRWTSLGEGTRALIDVYRSDFASAALRLEVFAASGRPDLLGLPEIARTHALLLEARRKLRPASEAAHRCWDRSAERGCYGWLPTFAVDCARIAARAGNADLARDVVEVLGVMPFDVPEAGAGKVALAAVMCQNGDGGEVVAAATHCATDARTRGDAVTEASGWEEAACAAGALGDRASARRYARSALLIYQVMHAPALSARVISRLRPHGVRLDPATVRERPREGWGSLTRTEVTVVELVASGLSGPEIADRLFISTRTVQTHISRALTKLNLRTRVELAAYVAGGRTSLPGR
ncbi:DNA-binding NarL/FixJ family response regulator [Dietzia sp. 2505]|uniref:helix-turn-helix transcriptional regulator n=1 Tax=Dietzia sp. 2505 TaxID=3156457 RepID=UPI003393BA22